MGLETFGKAIPTSFLPLGRKVGISIASFMQGRRDYRKGHNGFLGAHVFDFIHGVLLYFEWNAIESIAFIGESELSNVAPHPVNTERAQDGVFFDP